MRASLLFQVRRHEAGFRSTIVTRRIGKTTR
jgi:hypothetical protein